jgi:hypothetical protein
MSFVNHGLEKSNPVIEQDPEADHQHPMRSMRREAPHKKDSWILHRQ